MKKALTEIFYGVKSLFVGMRITIGQFFRPIVTVQYPYETLKIPARFRGHIELVRDPQSGKPKCFVCKLCEKACPSDCITVEGIKPEGAKRKTVTQYRLDFTKCSLCGSCVEACRDGAIRFSKEYNLAGLSKDEFIMDLFKRLEAERDAQPRPEADRSAGIPGTTTAGRSAILPAAGLGGVTPPVRAPGGTPGELAGAEACATRKVEAVEPEKTSMEAK
jgi:NADH-quinone oxidoreductase subunit I